MPRKALKTEERPAEPEIDDINGADALDDPDASDAAADDASTGQAVTFTLEGQLYGLPIEAVQEIQQLVEYTPLPDATPALVGLIDLRGTVVPAIDLRVMVGLAPRAFTLQTPMIFCRLRDHTVCLIVDGVEDVVDLPPEGLQPPSSLYSLADRMLGMCRLSQGLLLMLDIERLVPDAAIALVDRAGGDDR